MKKLISFTLATGLFLSTQHYASADFSDVPKNHSNYTDVQYLLEKGVVEDGSKYGINDIVTREEVAVMIAKAIGLDDTPRATKFNDVGKSNKNSGYIQSAVEAGIINGYDDDTFKPDAQVTRGHMAAFVSRAFDLPAGTKTFKDVQKGHTAYDAVSQLAAANITTGYEDGTFKPNGNLTRAHISAFLARAIQYQDENIQEAVVEPTPKPTPEPTKPVVVEVGKSRNTAAKLNQTVQIEVDDLFDGKQKYELTLIDVVSGETAWSMIQAENRFNDAPESGMKYVLAKFKVKLISLEEEPFDINHAQFDAVSKTGSMYNDYFSIVAPKPNLSTDLYSGAEFEGWTYFMVSEDDSPKVVYLSERDAETWFDLGL